MRLFFSGPRLMGIRPGFSFNPNELQPAPRPAAATGVTGSFVYVTDGTVEASSDLKRVKAKLVGGKISNIITTAGDGKSIAAYARKLLEKNPSATAADALLESAKDIGDPIQKMTPDDASQVIELWERSAQTGWSSPGATISVNIYAQIIKTIVKLILGAVSGVVIIGCVWMIAVVLK